MLFSLILVDPLCVRIYRVENMMLWSILTSICCVSRYNGIHQIYAKLQWRFSKIKSCSGVSQIHENSSGVYPINPVEIGITYRVGYFMEILDHLIGSTGKPHIQYFYGSTLGCELLEQARIKIR
jgi:hypothetical protein